MTLALASSDQPGVPLAPAAALSASASLPESTGDWNQKLRLAGLHRFALAITVLNLLGHGFLGFETAWAHPLAALATAYSLELLLEWIDARANGRTPRYLIGGRAGFGNFLLSPHISALAVSMLLYSNQRLWPVVFATAVAVGSKVMFRIQVDGRSRHLMNPSNVGIASVLVLFPWVGIAPPYQFTENVAGFWDWGIPLIIVCSGTFLNFRFTNRLVLLCAWLIGFILQALLRHWLLGNALLPSLAPITGLAFLLFSFYMITDPPTTPSTRSGQIYFGLSVAFVYGALMALHVVFGLFFSLVIVCGVRGTALALKPILSRWVDEPRSDAAVAPQSS